VRLLEKAVKNQTLRTRLSFLFFVRVFLFFLALLYASISTVAQQSFTGGDVKKDTPGTAFHPSQGLHIDVDLALINVVVTDPYNRPFVGLDPDNFRVFEDSVEQEIVTFSSEDIPISIGVIFDCSSSMSNKLGKAREAAMEFFKTSNPKD